MKKKLEKFLIFIYLFDKDFLILLILNFFELIFLILYLLLFILGFIVIQKIYILLKIILIILLYMYIKELFILKEVYFYKNNFIFLFLKKIDFFNFFNFLINLYKLIKKIYYKNFWNFFIFLPLKKVIFMFYKRIIILQIKTFNEIIFIRIEGLIFSILITTNIINYMNELFNLNLIKWIFILYFFLLILEFLPIKFKNKIFNYENKDKDIYLNYYNIYCLKIIRNKISIINNIYKKLKKDYV